MSVAVVGAGLAGCEAAWILAEVYRLNVTLFEMKSVSPTPAQSEPHHFAELVCSNSLKSMSRLNPAGLLKREMEMLGSLVMAAASQSAVPAGEALAVDRSLFSGFITNELKKHPRVRVVETVITNLKQVFGYGAEKIIVATGPLTADALAEDLRSMTGSQSLYFYDAIAPIIDGDSIDRSVAFFANRKTKTSQNKQELQNFSELSNIAETAANDDEEAGHYLNLPLNKEEYFQFVESLKTGEKVPFHNFEEPRFFNGCQPIEVLAESGVRTLAFGPMKPMGLTDPRTGRRPFAVVQLRREKLEDDSFNMVGFQTRLKWPEQKRIFRQLPGLAQAEFHRMGSMHRNTYLVSPQIINKDDLSLKSDSRVWLAGQITGVEGYLESAATGLLMGHVVGTQFVRQKNFIMPPKDTAYGCLVAHLRESDPAHYCPMNIHWGLFSPPNPEEIEQGRIHHPEMFGSKTHRKLDKSLKRTLLADRAEGLFAAWKQRYEI